VYGDPDGLNYTYWYDSSHSLGLGIDIYIVDTGINTGHVAFGGRAANLYPPGSNSTDDTNGHGTHVAGTAGGQYVGIAYQADIIGVQTLGADGSGPSNDTLSGIEWVINRHASRVQASLAGQDPAFVGSVINLSLSFSTNNTAAPSQALYRAIQAATETGIHVVGIAGNDIE
jgi:cerevisin